MFSNPNYLEVVPAYGADYKNQREVKEAWNSGKDFRDTATDRYCNKADVEKYFPNASVIVRYAKSQKLVSVRTAR